MKVLIIEDEAVAAQRLQILLKDYDSSIQVLGCLDSIEESVAWLQQPHEHPDILLLDIQLADGFSFEILKRTDFKKPVIFTTAYNSYALEAFRYFSIDYLLKPVSFESLKTALDKFKLITNVNVDYSNLFTALKDFSGEQYKERFLARVGQKLIFVKTSDIIYFRAADKVVYIVDKQGNKLPIDYTLEKLETLLHPRRFFRLNRKVIVSIDSIAQVKPYYNSRLMLYLKDGHKSDDMIISRERVPEFREWAEKS